MHFELTQVLKSGTYLNSCNLQHFPTKRHQIINILTLKLAINAHQRIHMHIKIATKCQQNAAIEARGPRLHIA